VGDVLSRHLPVDALDSSRVRVGLDRTGRDMADRMDGVKIGEDGSGGR
jgi:hypothetical protein